MPQKPTQKNPPENPPEVLKNLKFLNFLSAKYAKNSQNTQKLSKKALKYAKKYEIWADFFVSDAGCRWFESNRVHQKGQPFGCPLFLLCS
jgi:hypothetical protein